MTAASKPWNKHRIIGQKRPLKISHIWGIRIRLEIEDNKPDLALFNMALDSKLRGCDLVKLLVSDVMSGGVLFSRISCKLNTTNLVAGLLDFLIFESEVY